MAVHILDRQDPGARLGTALGTGLSGALEGLAQYKINQVKERQNVPAIKRSIPGLSEEEYTQLAKVDPALLQNLLKSEADKSYQNNFKKQFGIDQQQQQPITQQLEPSQPVDKETAEAQKLLKVIETPQEQQALEPNKPPQAQIIKQKEPIKPSISQNITINKEGLSPTINKLIQEGYPIPKNAKEATDLVKLAHETNLSEKKFEQKERLAEKQLNSQEKREAFKETKDIRHAAYEKGREAKNRLDQWARLDELAETGNIASPGYILGLQNLGLDIPNLLGKDTEEAQKILAGQLRDIGKVFKGAISQYDIENFTKMIPTLLNSPEGIKRLSAQFKRFDRMENEYANAVKKVIKDHDGIPPLDLEEEADDILEERREKISEQFKKDLAKPVPEGQSGFSTAVLSLAGSAGGALGAGAKKVLQALPGAAVGAFFGGPIGAGIGGAASSGLFDLLSGGGKK